MKLKKRIIVALVLIFTIAFSGCNTTEPAPMPEEKYGVTEQLIVSLQGAEFTEPKNIIYMIGDGMGANIIQATQEKYADELYGGKLAINYLNKVGTHSTYSASDKTTDSAAGGTALATGNKTSNYTVGLNIDHTMSYKTVLELAAEKGKSTGIIATKSVTDATPAAFTTHVEDRKMQNEIAKQQLQKIVDGTLDLVLGGGSEYYEYFDNDAVFEEAESKGMSYSEKWEDTQDDKLPLVGLYARDALLTTSPIIPSLAEMTDFALGLLSEDENGFFLMVEGSQIDTEAHDNKLDREMHEMYQFDCAIAVAMEFVASHPDTVLIVTADHETGGLYFPEEGYVASNKHTYLYDDHSFINVPVYALGYGIDALGGIMENTDIAQFVASLLGEENFGQDSVVTGIYDDQTNGKLKFTFDETNICRELFSEDMLAKFDTVKNVRALHFPVTNKGTEKVTLPALKIQTAAGATYDVIPQYAYINAGETLDLTYVLPVELWQDNIMGDVNSIQITYEVVEAHSWKTTFGYETEVAELEIGTISVTDRGLEN